MMGPRSRLKRTPEMSYNRMKLAKIDLGRRKQIKEATTSDHISADQYLTPSIVDPLRQWPTNQKFAKCTVFRSEDFMRHKDIYPTLDSDCQQQNSSDPSHKRRTRADDNYYSSSNRLSSLIGGPKSKDVISKQRKVSSLGPSQLLLLATCLFVTCLFLMRCQAYQLTNNLIANNLPPKFIQSPASTSASIQGASTASSGSISSEIVVRVKEGPQSIGKLIYTLRGEDPDEDPLTFGVLGSTASELLRIENTPGNQANVYLRKELDRETTESHQVVITLTDGKLGKGNWVEDVNDNYPVFGPHRTAISIREDTKWPVVIETLEATDADEGRFGQVIYKLDELAQNDQLSSQDPSSRNVNGQSISSMFLIETIDGKGVISLIGQLDYEQRPLYQLRILAIDRAVEHERLSTSTSILISVEDCEDQAPMFTFAPSITRIPEDLPVGSPILRLSAIDGDRGVNNPIKYSIIAVNNQESGYERNLFSIGSDSGQISVAHELDRELALGFGPESLPVSKQLAGSISAQSPSQPGAYVLQVRATEVHASLLDADSDTTSNSCTTELTVILTDVNDETPRFNREQFYGELLENSPAESLVNFIVSPPSGSLNGQQHSTAAATTTPNFEVGPKVFDRDQGTNGTFTLHLEGEHGHLFEVWPSEATNEASLLIKVSSLALQEAANLKYFDYEKTKELRLTLIAREKVSGSNLISRPRFSSAELVVYLRDSNDNYPQFDSELYRVEIPENAQRGMHICVVKAIDFDSNSFGSTGIRYTEIRGERANKFKLDPQTGVITLKTNDHGFDRETIPQHHLIVEARDNNGQGNRNTTQLLIILTDVNDQRPKFLLDQYEAFIYENELDFQSPLQVQALDGDAPGSMNAKITYSIVGGDPQSNFTIDPETGRIRVRSFPIMSSASNVTPRSQSTLLAAPPITTGMGDQSEPDIVMADSSLVQSQQQPNLITGLDFERIAQKRDETRQFNLTIKATDAGLPESLSDTTQVVVLVYDKNDHAPAFTRPVYSKSIREDAPGGSAVIQVQALDGDHSPTNSKITYRISSGASDKFVIDSDSGLISVANGANLDIDRVQGAGQRRLSYLLNILASDGSFGPNQKSSSALVNITIIDVNNKAPEFISLGASHAQYASMAPKLLGLNQNQQQQQQQQQQHQVSTVFVNEDAPYGLIVTRVFATDLDSGAELRYSINYSRSEARNEEMALVEPNLYRDVFTIEPTDGTIKVSKQLDRELFDQVKLRLQVEDIGAQTPDQMSYTYLTIKITDVNDNRPTFKKPVYKAVVNENSISGTSVITLTADDRDLNKTLKYSLEASSPELARLIRINPRSGDVTVNDKIDRELFPMINVTIKAEDYGQPHSLTGSCQLIVTVRDENDNNPIFLNSTHIRPSNSPPTVSSTGRQIHPLEQEPRNHNMQEQWGATTSYRHRSLGLPSSPGELEVKQVESEDRQEIGTGQTRRKSADDQGRELSLLAPGATAQVREDAPIGHQIAYVRAEDADVGNNGRVTYLIDANSNSNGKFRIDRDSGILSVAQTLDRELQQLYTLIIEACDNYDLGYSTGESRRAFTQINIQVTDINDNIPVIATNLQATSSLSSQSSTVVAPTSSPASNRIAGGYPTYDEAMQSFGPYDLPLADCLFINEFQASNEPILTITASDLDDPELPNGQVDLAIVNNLPQIELFSLVQVAGSSPNVQPILNDEPVTVSDTNNRSPDVDHNSFGESLVESESKLNEQRLKRHISDDELRQLEPGNFYSPHPLSLSRSSSSIRGMQTAPFPSSQPVIMTTTTTTSTTSAPRSILKSANQKATSKSSGSAGNQQMHLVVSQSLKERVGNYSILVRATDRGQPALTSVKLINVCVQDVNNHAPVFTRPPLNHTIRIMENATLGSFVTQVEANDLDHGLNGELQYLLKPTNIQNSNNDWQSFKIDRLSGIISTTKLFNRQIKRYYTLRVQAQDFGRPTSLSSDIDINIMIVNSGNYQPEFELQKQALQFTENSKPGQEWFTLSQTTNLDDDPALIHVNNLFGDQKQQLQQPGMNLNGSNWLSSPCYFIIDGDDHEQAFHLDRYNHRLTNQRELDRERKANYTLIVQASNNCNKPPVASKSSFQAKSGPALETTSESLSSTISSTTESGDNELRRSARAAGPQHKQFLRRSEDAPVDLTTTVRTPLGGDKAQLATWTTNADTKTGQVDGSTDQLVNTIANWDSMVASDKSLLKVCIKIRDLNDNAPKFTQHIYTGGITTEADFGTTFMIVQAIDPDADANGQVTYSIVRPIKRNLSLSSVAPSSSLASFSDSINSDLRGHRLSSLTTSSSSLPLQTIGGRQRRSAPTTTTTTTSLPITVASTTMKPTKLQLPFHGNAVNEIYTNEPASSSLDQHHSNHEQQTNYNGANSDNNNPSLFLAESEELFVISAQTGEISLNFDPQKHMKGYFEFEILAKDPDGLQDKARVLIYLLRQDQRVKFVLRLTPQELRQRLNKFRSVIGNITGAIVNIDSYKYYENHDGTVDKKKTSLYLHFVNADDNTIIDVDKVLTLIDNNIEYLDELYKEFHVLSSEAAHLPLNSGALVDPIDQVRTGLMGISSFLALILVLVIALCLNQRTRYERQLKAATVSAFGGLPHHLDPEYQSQTNLPNTNLHSQDPNPIWINGHYGNRREDNQPTDWLADMPTDDNRSHHDQLKQQQQQHYHTKRPGSQMSQSGITNGNKAQQKQRQQQEHHKLYHSASSGVGMALDDDELDCLSISEGDHSSDLNSLSGGANSVTKLHYNVATATATPRDSLNSSHGQVSSSSGSNSASTTNERQVLYTGNANAGRLKSSTTTDRDKDNKCRNSDKHHQSKVKLNGNRKQQTISESTMATGTATNSTFGAFKEVTIYTENQRQNHHQAAQHKPFSHLVAEQHNQQATNQVSANNQNARQTTANASISTNQATSHVNKLASQFNKAKLQKNSIYVVGNQKQQQAQNQNSYQKTHIVVHSNGSDVAQGIIKSSAQVGEVKQLINNLDAKFVPANHDMTSVMQQQQQQQQDQSVNNFETNLSKLSILNLETTEL